MIYTENFLCTLILVLGFSWQGSGISDICYSWKPYLCVWYQYHRY